MEDVLKLIGRNSELFVEDLARHEAEIRDRIEASNILVIGGAGSIGSATVKEIFRRNPQALHVVDLSENSMVEN